MAEKNSKTNLEDLKFTERLENMMQFAKALDDVLQLVDLTSSTTKTWTIFNKDTLRTYLQSPYSTTSQNSLRNIAKFLYTLSFPLRRVISYFASLPDFTVYKVIPNISMVEEPDGESILKDYEEVCRYVRSMDLQLDLVKLLTIAWREDMSPFYVYTTDEGEMLLFPLDGQYCRISSVGYDGLFKIAYDFSFFAGSNAFYLDIWDPEFKKKYNAYNKDSSLRWQELDNGYCFKINIDNPDLILSPLASLFEAVIDLIDLQSLTSVKDALEIYKLLVMKIPLLNSQSPDDLALSLSLAQKFYQKALNTLPPEIGLVLSPGMDVDSVSFDKSATSDSDAISDAYSNLMSNAGVSQIMDSSRLTGQSAVKASMICDIMMATKSIIPQVNAFVNRMIKQKFPSTQMIVRFTDVTAYTKEDRIKQLQTACEYGLPFKLELAAVLGQDPLESYAMDWLENQLGLAQTRWVSPLISSHTKTTSPGEETGAPTKDDGDLTDDGEASREKRDQNG